MKGHVVGLDIGTSAIRAVELTDVASGTPTLLHYFETPLPVGAVVRGEIVDADAVRAALGRIWDTGGFTSHTLVLGVASDRVVARNLTVPSGSLKRIREALPLQVRDLISVPLDEALLDFYPISSSDGPAGPETQGLFIAAAKAPVITNVRAVQQAGLRVLAVDLVPFALSRAVTLGTSTDRVIAQIDVGAGSTSVVIAVDGVPQFVRLVAAGGNDVTAALKNVLGVNETSAENVKRLVGLSHHMTLETAGATTTISEVTYELLDALRNTINYFGSLRRDLRVTQIVLAGGASRLIGFADTLSQLTGLPVVYAQPTGMLLGPGIDAAKLRATQGTYLTACGLALGRATPANSLAEPGGEPRADLLPAEVRMGQAEKTLRRRSAAVIALVAVLVAVGIGFSLSERMQATRQLQTAQDAATLLINQEKQFAELHRLKDELDEVRDAQGVTLSTEIDWQAYLGELRESLPDGVSITSVSADGATPFAAYGQSAVPLEGARVATLRLSLASPELQSNAVLLRRLSALPGFVDATPGQITRTATGGYLATFTMHINSEAYSTRDAADASPQEGE
ncbi:type IV pilus assembly protein PilM [Cryobacterium melibiosiphilum]|uniref:Type IV pilus assembly protein PilM n=1 Tax=Cryobacterium melibiosiphilum TaxID=995039 RepID=A0A3A5MN07_9MICO|nr:type IV pilus assembly protein PilM [Cryobacterium melibiosiphilum]RJT88518.1 type IV pilus assembly protein PilM [Cryobacterium melibiosiphilum]